jgi:low affinity Fe/Cu permease
MVYLIQNTQSRDNDILHLKIDELVGATKNAQKPPCAWKTGVRATSENCGSNTAC